MKFIVETNLSREWCQLLTKLGYTAIYWLDVGDPSAEDITIIEHAKATNSIILTADTDFGTLLTKLGYNKPSVIRFKSNLPWVSELGDQFILALNMHKLELETGVLITLSSSRVRVNKLPLK